MKKILAYAGIVILFAFLAYAFVPQVLSNKVINQSDTSSWKGMTHEISEWNKEHPDDKALWTGSMFGGMPTAAMYDDFEGDWTKPLYNLLMLGKRPANWLFVAMLGAFLLMLSLGIDKLIAAGGAIAVAFCSYNMQIIQVGHNTKMQAIALMPWVLAAMVFTYRSMMKEDSFRKLLPKAALGSVLFALAVSFQIKANHPQISYYLAIVILLYAASLVIWMLVEKKPFFKNFCIASAMLLVVGGIGIATNANKLIPTWKYSRYTMRGGSELAAEGSEGNDKGLDLDYATAWSYGIDEMPNLMIPDYNGGASSGKLSRDSSTGKLLRNAGYKGKQLDDTLSAMPLYWGPQPFTAGPMYMGCISIFLFVLGLLLLKGKEKWWLLAATVIAVMLAWGNHMMWFTRLWFDHVPLYSKFRTVSMALVVLQLTVPMLGFLVLDRIIRQGYSYEEFSKPAWTAFALTAGFCLISALFPGIAGTFTSDVDSQLPEALADSLADDRRSLLTHDALRSFMLISVVFCVLLWGFGKSSGKGKSRCFAAARSTWAASIICVLVLSDMFIIGKRYLNESHFMTKKDFSGQFDPRPVDRIILEDDDRDYRVLDISVNTFNDAFTAYHHKCIGGYSPVKLQRYQDLIDRQLRGEISKISASMKNASTISDVENSLPEIPVLNALNCKYIIIGGDYPPVRNQSALGNAWFVNGVTRADRIQDEIGLLSTTDLASSAVVGKDFIDKVGQCGEADGGDFIKLESYSPNRMVYSYRAENDRLAVFSEVFYPEGWSVSINGKESELLRADWILRAANIPAGNGEIVMTFRPDSYSKGKAISKASSVLLLILLVYAVQQERLIQEKSA